MFTAEEIRKKFSQGAMMKIMIVDDNAGMRKAMKGIAANASDVVMECADGEEAVRSFGQFHPDVVLMDIQMPKMDGIQATKKIIQSDAMARVIIVTDFDTESFRAAAQHAGARAYVSKENLFEITDLLQR